VTLYLDASAILRILFPEKGVRAPFEKGKVLVSSKLAEVETARAVERAHFSGLMDAPTAAQKSKELRILLGRLHLASVTDAVIERARQTFPVSVRALDAVHVASAEILQEEAGALEFWTHDRRQAVAAISRGLEVRGID
jgi:predicted nucleic acid-binding protein